MTKKTKIILAGTIMTVAVGTLAAFLVRGQTISNEAAVISSGAVKVPILIFHAVNPPYAKETEVQRAADTDPALLGKVLQYIQDNGFTPITFDALADYFDKDAPLPPKPVILSFDDGWKSQYLYAFPLLKKYNFSATFFIYTWAMGASAFMSWEQIKDLDKSGMVIGSHTRSHPRLTEITDPQKLWSEIAGSKQDLEKVLGKTITNFAYPYGHYNAKVVALVKQAGFRTARTTYRGTSHNKGDLLTFKGIMISNSTPDFAKWLQ